MRKIEKEKRLVLQMIHIYCRKKEGNRELCDQCRELADYVNDRLSRCQFGEQKPACKSCKVHCYKPVMRERIREVMRFSGRRIFLHHPLISLRHLFLLLLCVSLSAVAQQNVIYRENIKTLQALPNDSWGSPAVLTLGSGDYLRISFDDLSHEYHRYIYKIQHCGFDWQPSTDIFESDFMTGTNGATPIDDYKQSLNTTVLYTHYTFSLPNDNARLLLSGNYRVTIYNDDGDQPDAVACVCFSIVEPRVALATTVTTNTDIDYNATHQQLGLTLSYNALTVADPLREIKTVVLQNRRWDNAAINVAPNYQRPAGLQWDHNQALIFPGGDEYHKFELTNVHYGSMGVDRIAWISPYYHATLFPTALSKNYIYEEDQNGHYLVRTDNNNDDDDTQADYLLFHFSLVAPPRLDGAYYLDGDWANSNDRSQYQLQYNADAHVYEASVLLKEGYYNYQYLFFPTAGGAGLVDGSNGYFQTENEYCVYAYYRPIGGRYDRLVGFQRISYKGGN